MCTVRRFRRVRVAGILMLPVLWLGAPAPVAAQSNEPRPATAMEFTGGYAGFADDATIDHVMVGGAMRFHLSPRISVGPEIQYMIGPDSDRDLILTGNLTFDVLSPGRRITPFLVAGGGLFHHSNSFGGRSFSSSEGAFTAGGGVRAWASDRVYVAAELRMGWELHYRITGTVGVTLGSQGSLKRSTWLQAPTDRPAVMQDKQLPVLLKGSGYAERLPGGR